MCVVEGLKRRTKYKLCVCVCARACACMRACMCVILSLPLSPPTQDIDTSLVKLLAEDHSASLVPYITNHDLHLSFDETKQALEDYKVAATPYTSSLVPSFIPKPFARERRPGTQCLCMHQISPTSWEFRYNVWISPCPS